ncbi:hypothetical protein ACF0H5_004822 [Mactra antiquata]
MATNTSIKQYGSKSVNFNKAESTNTPDSLDSCLYYKNNKQVTETQHEETNNTHNNQSHKSFHRQEVLIKRWRKMNICNL